jgi:hypothetical protein
VQQKLVQQNEANQHCPTCWSDEPEAEKHPLVIWTKRTIEDLEQGKQHRLALVQELENKCRTIVGQPR